MANGTRWLSIVRSPAASRSTDDRPGCRRREIHDFDAVGGEALAEEIPGRIGAERADQPNRPAPAGKANGRHWLPVRPARGGSRRARRHRVEAARTGTTWTSSSASPITVIAAVIGR